MKIYLDSADYGRIIIHAKACLPNEACGLVAGTRTNGDIDIERVYLLTNIDRSPEHFSIDPREQLEAVRDMRKNGLSPLGNFHSHPSSPARPSQEDIRLAADPKAYYLILSLAGEVPVLKAFSVVNGMVSQIELVIS